MLYLTITYFFSFRSPLRWDLCVIFNNHVFRFAHHCGWIYVLYSTITYLFVSLTIEVGFTCYIQQSRIFLFRSPLRLDLRVIFNNHVSFCFAHHWGWIYVLYSTITYLFVSLTIEVGFMCYIQQSCIHFFSFRSPLRWGLCVIFNNHVYISFRFAHHWGGVYVLYSTIMYTFLFVSLTIEGRFMC